MHEAFWWNSKNRERVGNRPAHIISYSYLTEDEAGCENDVYVSFCGEEMESWDYAPFEKKFGTLEGAINDGAGVCEKCLKLKQNKNSDSSRISKLENEVKELKEKNSQLENKEYETKEPEMISFLVSCNNCDGSGYNHLGQKCGVCDGTGSAVRTREVQPCDYEEFNHSYPNNGF